MRTIFTALCLLVASCDGGSRDGASRATVLGTTLDVDTREPIAQVEVTGPSDSKTKSDEHGRFRLRNLPVGTEGEIAAHAADGRAGSVTLRPLEAGELEVVVYLRAPAPPEAGPAPADR